MTIELRPQIAQRREQVDLGHQRRERDHRGGTDHAQRERHDRELGQPRPHVVGVEHAPHDEPCHGEERPRLYGRGDAEEAFRQHIAAVEIDEARGEFVDHHPAGFDPRDLERGGDEPDDDRRHAPRELGEDEEDRQQVDEPQRAERLDEGFEIERSDAGQPVLDGEAGRLDGELDRHPQHVEIDEMHDLAVEIGAPVALDHAGQEQSGDQEEVGHAKGLGEGDDVMHPAFLPERRLDPQGGMHRHHHDDAQALGVVDPVDAFVLSQAHRVLPRDPRLCHSGTGPGCRHRLRKRRANGSGAGGAPAFQASAVKIRMNPIAETSPNC